MATSTLITAARKEAIKNSKNSENGENSENCKYSKIRFT